MNKKIHAYLMLFLVTIIWGATFPLIHNSVQLFSPNLFVLFRFGIASALLLPFMWQKLRNKDTASLKYGIILGLINGCTFVLQTIALQTLDSARTAFLTTTYIVLVPLMLPIFGFRKPTVLECIAALICLYGVYTISGAHLGGFQWGDIIVIASAFTIAIGLIIVEYATLYSKSNMVFNFYQIVVTVFLPLAMLVGKPVIFSTTMGFWFSVGFRAIFATAVAFMLQVKYQRVVGASKTALIFSLEAVFASIFAWMNGEVISRQIIIGGGIILFSIILVDVLHIFKKQIK